MTDIMRRELDSVGFDTSAIADENPWSCNSILKTIFIFEGL